jgi:hypothetical protein
MTREQKLNKLYTLAANRRGTVLIEDIPANIMREHRGHFDAFFHLDGTALRNRRCLGAGSDLDAVISDAINNLESDAKFQDILTDIENIEAAYFRGRNRAKEIIKNWSAT